ncbi:hypothetical protein DSM104635_01925 [Terricaulis silvestris]|uniref:DUF4167 domain-containing protein n=2 Tax=Terricaulis silvestris TaxID=2686094 RepID=A0A6I6MQY0_9CAUL|nr:hypothetical protein DSM104635_01925 [Terricaulis silvestris]
MESNGPETKVRGPASVIYERYLQLARDATSSGDRVLGENYLQHADHYFRLVRSMQPAQPHPQQQQDRFNDAERDGYEEGSQEMDRAEGGETSPEGDEQPDAEFSQGQPQHGQDREGGNRRRGRRNRFRPGEGEGAEAAPREGGGEERTESRPPREPRAEGEAREPRRERAPREQREEREAGPEGFSSGPKPAFLRGD